MGLLGCGSKGGFQQAAQHNRQQPEKAAEINMQLGIEYMRRQQYDIALNRLEKALEIDPNYADGHNAMAVLYEQLGQTAQAQQHFQQALQLNPSGSDIHNNYGQFLCKRGQWEQAQQHFSRALENPLYRTPEIPLTNAALCAVRAKNYSRADSYLTQVLQKNPESLIALYQMSLIRYEQGQYTDAQNYFRRYLRLGSQSAETLWLGVRLARALNDPEQASQYAAQLRSQYPDSSETRLLNQLERQ
ncbi:type IV pilus biogenesis/stability protein PilW [Thioflexithrix psekupsensis]|uniref:Type IV pilus biogenesis/stability protein PilW n=2 Tax=Thioflexithrix psekupsensis TaxID=1570016 RepID=A0A251X5G3_9GAMM|nr:type IV pilus biogenesis/stability protein PilW [Thioflexithrix psekupsensis]